MELHFHDPLQLLVSTILSAQCTDERVNKVTPHLFSKYKTARDYARANPRVFEKEVHSTGFFRSKARHIIAACKIIDEKYDGVVPETMGELLELPGVARKTANIVLSIGFGKAEGIAVDTHVSRVSQRLGLSKNTDPNKIERDLTALIPQKMWIHVNSLLVLFGRYTCTAKKPRCRFCPLKEFCPSRQL